jgi:hypothetical protein
MVAVCVRVTPPLVAVAVTVTLLVPAGVPVGAVDEPPPLPLLLLHPTMPDVAATSSRASKMLRARLLRKKSIMGMPNTPTIPRAIERALADRVVVTTVKTTVDDVVPGVMVAGEKLQVVAAGNPEQVNETVVAKPPVPGATVNVAVLPVDAPAVNVRPAVGPVRVKSATATTAAVDVAALYSGAPA